MKIVTVGNAIIDYYVDLKKKFPGGSALNVAVYSQKFGAEKSSFIGVVGNDKEGNHIINTLNQKKIDYSQIRQRKGRTGKVYITLNENNDRKIGEWERGVLAEENFELNERDISFILKHDLLHVGVNSNVLALLSELSKKIKLSFDFSTQKKNSLLESIAPHLHIAFLSCSDMTIEEIKRLGRYIHSLGTKHVFLTRGEKGATYFGDEGFLLNDIKNTSEIIDTLGAGDTFVAYCLSRLYGVASIEELLMEASENATETCYTLGGFGNPLLSSNI